MSKEMVDFVKSRGVFTGSRAFGVETESSDYDYALCPEDYQQFIDSADKSKLQKAGYFIGVYFFNGLTIGGIAQTPAKYNVFMVRGKELPAWRLATKMMQILCSDREYADLFKKDRVKRISTFEMLRALLRKD